jgi:hypothetical protein
VVWQATTTVLYAVLIVYVLVPACRTNLNACNGPVQRNDNNTFVLYNYDYLKQMKKNKKD